jgi:hypothetical protein
MPGVEPASRPCSRRVLADFSGIRGLQTTPGQESAEYRRTSAILPSVTTPALRLLSGECQHSSKELSMGRILIGVVIGIILVIWLLASCVGVIF